MRGSIVTSVGDARWPALLLVPGLLLAGAAPARSAPRDPAPIADEVVETLVRRPLVGRPVAPAESLAAHLDHAGTLLARLETETRSRGGQEQDPVAPTTALMLVGSKLQEIQTARLELRNELGRIQPVVRTAAQRRVLDDLALEVEQRFDRIAGVLEAVRRAATRGAQLGAVASAKADLRALHETPRDARRTVLDPPPTITQQRARPREPEPDPAPPPRYVSSSGRWPGPQAAGVDVVLASDPPTEAQACGTAAEDLAQNQEIQLTPDIQALAASLGHAPARIYQWVTNEIAFQPYWGSLKGATGTLVSRSGGPVDQASLLIALLRASNVRARYVRGQAQFSLADARVLRWLGARDFPGARAMLDKGLIPALHDPAGARFVLQHVWVEACVPYTTYRGTRIDSGGYRWIPLDPSFKEKAYQAGIVHSTDFDYAGYLAARTNLLPHELYATQVEEAIKSLPPNFSGNTVEDVGFVGRVVPRTIDILPASLPYRVIAFNAWAPGLPADIAEVPDSHRYKLEIEVRPAAGVSDTPLVPGVTLSLPEVALERVTLAFKGAQPQDQAVLDGLAPTGTIACGLASVVPSIRVDGVERSAPGTGSVDVCTTRNRLTLRVTLAKAGAAPINEVDFSNIEAANLHALFAFAFQTSDQLLAARAARLLASVRSIADPGTDLEETEGELLHLVGLKYMRYLDDGYQRIGALDGGSGQSGHHLGLASARRKVQYVFDLPFAVSRSGFLVDFPGGQSRNVDLTTGLDVWKSVRLMGYTSSAYESYIWQENARLDAVSTVRGIQFAAESAIPVLTITPGGAATALCSAATPCGGVDPALFYPGSFVAMVQDALGQGYTVTLPRQLIRYGPWTGAVWIQERSADLRATFGISGGYAGGLTLSWPSLFADVNSLDTGWVFEIVHDVGASAAAATPRVVNSAVGGGVTIHSTLSNDPVNLVTGNLVHTERDLAIKGRGLPVVFARTYNSRFRPDAAWPLGVGWTHSFRHRLLFDDDNADGAVDGGDTDGVTSSVTWIDGTGSEKFIRVAGIASGVAVGASFTAPRGFFFSVARQPDGTYSIREKNGLTYTFAGVAGRVGEEARLERITDRNGNALTLAYASPTDRLVRSVTDGLGRALTFTYAGDRLIELGDWTGRRHQYGYDGAGNLVTYRNPHAVAGLQNPVTYAYYTGAPLDHAMRSYTLPRGNGMRFEYYANGKVFRHIAFGAAGQDLDQVTTFTYNDFRREAVTIDERGHRRQFFFDKFGNPTRTIEANGAEHISTYDPAAPRNRASQRDPLGLVTRYCYDARGNVTRVLLPSASPAEDCQTTAPGPGTIVSSYFDAFDQPGKIRDARGHYTIMKYDARGNLLETIRLAAGVGSEVVPTPSYAPDPADVVAWTVNTYDPATGDLLTVKQVRDPVSQAGPTTTLAYDAAKLNVVGLTRCGDKDGVVATVECDTSPTLVYDSLGRARTGLRPDWHTTQADYDDVDRVIRASDARGRLRDFAYDPNGNLTLERLIVADVVADERRFTYDLADRRISEADAGGFITRFQHDQVGNLVMVTNPDNHAVRFDHDAANRVVRASDEEGHAVTRTLDAAGRPRAVTDASGHTTRFVYYGPERGGRLKQRIGPPTTAAPAGRTTTFDYDARGNVVSVTDHLGRTTRTSHDELDRPVRIVGPEVVDPAVPGGPVRPVTCHAYDLLGRLVTVDAGWTRDIASARCSPATDTVGPQMTYAWDDFGRKLRETDALGRSWTWAYDLHDNPLVITDARGVALTMTWEYGHQPLSRTAGGQTTTWTRNALGQVTEARGPDVTYTYRYDAAHRLSRVSDNRGAKTLTYGWSPGGLLNVLEDSEGNRTDYAYDAVGRLAGIWSPDNDLISFFHDAAGRLIEKWLPNGVTTRYTWNADWTLAQVVNRAGAQVVSQHDYAYDAVGNRVAHAEQIASVTVPYQYGYDGLDRLVSVTGSGLVAESYAYDVLGNRTQRTSDGETLAYRHDVANQLLEVRQGTPSGTLLAGLVYDANGNLTRKCEGGAVALTETDCSGTGTTATTLTYNALGQLTQVSRPGIPTQGYTYDDQGRRLTKLVGTTQNQYLYSGPDIVAEYGASWTAARAILTHGPGMDDPLVRTLAAVRQYFHQDGLGSVVGVTNSGGTTVGNARYDAWGAMSTTGAVPLYGYTGREPDGATGLVYYRARYYDPALGRFIQRDPSGLDDGVNLYRYARGNPTTLVDPLGLAGQSPLQSARVQAELSYTLMAPGMTAGLQNLGAAGGFPPPSASLAVSTPHPSDLEQALEDASAAPMTGMGYVAQLDALDPQARATLNEAVCLPCLAVAAPVLVGTAVRAVPQVQRAAQQAGLALQRAHGYATQNVSSVLRTGALVRPDEFNVVLRRLSEIKLVRYLAYTQQLKEYAAVARSRGFAFYLHAPGATLSRPLLHAIQEGDIILAP
jgi:RHS repeat-associated protein